MLAVYGGRDARVTPELSKPALEAARLRHRIVTFTDADHAFFNDTGQRFDAPAAEESWARVLAWFGRRRD